MRKFLVLSFVFFAICSVAAAKTNYWVVTDKTADGLYLTVKLLSTTSDTPPTKTAYGKDVSVSAGPFTSKMDATTNCNTTVKVAKKSHYLIKNYCSQTIKGQ